MASIRFRSNLTLFVLGFLLIAAVLGIYFRQDLTYSPSLNTITPSMYDSKDMGFGSEPSGIDDARRALFQCADKFLKLQAIDHSHEAEIFRRQFHSQYRPRVTVVQEYQASRSDLAHALLFTAEDKWLMQGMIQLYHPSDEEKQWFLANIDQANYYIKVLVGEERTRYPDVDAPSQSDDDGKYTEVINDIIVNLIECGPDRLPFERFSAVAHIQYINDQGRLAKNLELQRAENEGALRRAEDTDWTDWPYGAVVIVGHSPTKEESDRGVAVSLMAKDKIKRAIEMNEEHNLAPFYIFCGGSVRPRTTTIVESKAMRDYALKQYNLTSDQTLIDATSEHTYSNFINTIIIADQMEMPVGTKLILFFVPDRYGNEDQYDFSINRLMDRAAQEVYPLLDRYLTIVDGPWDLSLYLQSKGGLDTFLSPTLLWKDFTGELEWNTRSVFF